MKKLLLILSTAMVCQSSLAVTGFSAEQSKAINQYVDSFSKEHGLDQQQVRKAFTKVKLKKSILNAISNPHESLPWYKYRNIFLRKDRIEEGVAFWKKHRKTLEQAERKYGVPQEVIVAIIGIETKYGQRQGSYHVLDALTTLGFAYPPRAKFFKKELGQFLLLCKEQHFDPFSVQGSYAGAMGQPQFMPSSYRQYAVDFDRSGKRDLMHSPQDAIGSVGNYLKKNGWRNKVPLIYKAQVLNQKHTQLKQKSNRPQFTARTLNKYGVQTTSSLPRRDKFVWLPLDVSSKKQDYWVGSHNFYVITRYNTSKLYAMAAVQLSEAIKAAMNNKT